MIAGLLRLFMVLTLGRRMRRIALRPYEELNFMFIDEMVEQKRHVLRKRYRIIGLGGILLAALFILSDYFSWININKLQFTKSGIPELIIFISIIVLMPIICLVMFGVSFVPEKNWPAAAPTFTTMVAFRIITKRGLNKAIKKWNENNDLYAIQEN